MTKLVDDKTKMELAEATNMMFIQTIRAIESGVSSDIALRSIYLKIAEIEKMSLNSPSVVRHN